MTGRVEGIEYELSLADAGSDVYVQHMTLHDELNAPYAIEVRCVLPGIRAEPIQAVCERLVGSDVTLTMRRTQLAEVSETVRGVVVAVERAASRYDLELRRERGEAGDGEEAQDSVFVVHVAPAMKLLELHTWGSGSWHGRTIPEVLTNVLTEALAPYGRQVRDRTTQTDKVDHIVRPPGESLLAFVTRMMRVGGITSYFVHDGPREVVVLSDGNDTFIEGTQYQPRDQPFRVNYTQRHNVTETVQSLQAASMSRPGRVEFESFDAVGTPPVGVVGSVEAGNGDAAARRQWGDLRPTELGDPDAQHKRAAQLEVDRDATALNAVTAQTTILGMLAGRTFELELKPGDVRTYVVASVDASGKGAAYSDRSDYENQVQLVPLTTAGGDTIAVQTTAPDAARPMPGLTLAEIVGIENTPVEVDRLLRCRLKFIWDQQQGESPTTYVSVLQNMAGLFGGTQWIPRVGDRVVVAFHEGKADRGVILGALYDEQSKPPYMGPPDRASVLPESAPWLGWSHASVEPGTPPAEQSSLDRQTMLCMDVTANRELFYVRAPKDWRRDVGADSKALITGHEVIEIGQTLTETVGGSATQDVGDCYTQSVGAAHGTKVGTNHSLNVSGTSNVDVAGKRLERFGTFQMSVTSGTSMAMAASGRVDRTMGAWAASASTAINLRAPSVSVTSGPLGGGGMGAATGAALNLRSEATLEGPTRSALISGPSRVSAEPTKVSCRAATVTAADEAGGSTTLSQGEYVVEAPKGVTLRCGASELRLTPEGVFVNGHRVNISATTTEIETDRLDIAGD